MLGFYLRKGRGPGSKRNLTFNLLDPDQIRLTLCYTNYRSLNWGLGGPNWLLPGGPEGGWPYSGHAHSLQLGVIVADLARVYREFFLFSPKRNKKAPQRGPWA